MSLRDTMPDDARAAHDKLGAAVDKRIADLVDEIRVTGVQPAVHRLAVELMHAPPSSTLGLLVAVMLERALDRLDVEDALGGVAGDTT